MTEYLGMKVLLMGLGLHGGGLAAARFLVKRGAALTVTDLSDEKTLVSSIEQLDEAARSCGAAAVRYVLGRHETADFEKADMVIKNPGVKPGSPYLARAKRIETDISLFLKDFRGRLFAVTGSKGKSSAASALSWALDKIKNAGLLRGRVFLGGNITVSPLRFLDELTACDDVVLELSSWQLADLKGNAAFKPRCAVVTAILPDHQNWYGSMEEYVADKRIIGQGQDGEDAIIACDDEWGQSFFRESRARPLRYAQGPLAEGYDGGWLPGFARLGGALVEALPERLLVPGPHQRLNLLAAALALLDTGIDPEPVREALGSFPGIEHRLEFFHEAGGIRFYNDTAATIPEAAAAALGALSEQGPVILVAGGTDKNLDFSPLSVAAVQAKTVVLLAGSGTGKLKALLDNGGIPSRGPFDTPETALAAALEEASPGDTVLLSPGCASFGMFQNEFDRGRRWKETVKKMCGGH